MRILKELSEIRTGIHDINSQATRKKRATSLKRYLVTDLDIIEENTDLLYEKLKKVIEYVVEQEGDTRIQDVDYPYCPKKACGMRQQHTEDECRWCGSKLTFPKVVL